MTELVTVTIDDREVQVPKGTGLVETAAAAGIEIPVFCYEPRLGPPVGACRMCLVEIEGMPKLQAGCTLTAQDGMVVKTARDLREGGRGPERDARVHPRQPPARLPGLRQGRRVPAAGPDVPLRAGQHADDVPEADVREADPGLAADRARPRALHPLLPLHALLRGRGRGRRARRATAAPTSMIATFEDEPYRAPFSGNVDRALPRRRAHLDAVPLRGAAVGDPERPDGLRALPGRLQTQRDDARGQGEARSSRATTPRSTAAGSATRAASRSRTSTRATASASRCGAPAAGLEAVSWDDALDRGRTAAARAQAPLVTALSGTETIEHAYALGRLAARGLGSHAAVLPERPPTALDAFRAAALRDRRRRDRRGPRRRAGRRARPDRRPLAQAARRNGAEVVVSAPTDGRRPGGRGRAAASSTEPRSELGEAAARAERAVLVWSGPGGGGGARLAAARARARLRGQAGCGAFHLPATPNGRGVAEAWAAAADEGEPNPEPLGLLIVSGDEAAADPSVRALAERAERVSRSRCSTARRRLGRPRPARDGASSSATGRR